jgi:hypothetical protein
MCKRCLLCNADSASLIADIHLHAAPARQKLTSSFCLPRAASLQLLNKNDPLDQKLEAVLAPTADPILGYISSSPALSGAIVSLLGQYPNLLSALEGAAVPILDGFNALILGNGNPLSQAIGGAASSNPLADEVLDELQQVTNVTSPLVQALTVC